MHAPSALAQSSDDAAAATIETSARPAFLRDPDLTIQGEPTAADLSYETRVLGAFGAVQGSQGPLDGGWQVLGSDGAVLYTLQLTDPGAGDARIEGAWRNPRDSGAAASGFIDSISRENEDLVLSFREADAEHPTQVRLRPAANGGYVGETVLGAQRTRVTINRAEGIERASMAVPAWTQPAPPPVKAKAKPKPKSKAKTKTKRKRR